MIDETLDLREARIPGDKQQRALRGFEAAGEPVRILAEQPIREVEMWDLVSALGRVMQQAANAQPPCIVYDDTPISVYMQRLHDRLAAHAPFHSSGPSISQSRRTISTPMPSSL